MEIPIYQFEKIINNKILKRGITYFKNGYVADFKKVGDNFYQAIVLGNEQYTVELKTEDKHIIEYDCDCPYDGIVCKHVVASIYCLQEELDEETQIIPKDEFQKTAKNIEMILDTLSHDELKKFIQEYGKRDYKFGTYFVVSFDERIISKSRESYYNRL